MWDEEKLLAKASVIAGEILGQADEDDMRIIAGHLRDLVAQPAADPIGHLHTSYGLGCQWQVEFRPVAGFDYEGMNKLVVPVYSASSAQAQPAAEPIAVVVNKYGDPDAFAERALDFEDAAVQILPIGTKLFAQAQPAAGQVAMKAAINSDVTRMNAIEAHPGWLQCHKNKWSFTTPFTSYAYDVFKTAREAVDNHLKGEKQMADRDELKAADQAVHRVDYLGLALELESASRMVKSQTVRRAMEAGAYGLRLALAQPPAGSDALDAQRYRWLREQHWSNSQMFVVSGSKSRVHLGTDCPSHALLDDAIDRALLDAPGSGK